MRIYDHDHPAWYDLSFDVNAVTLSVCVPRPVAAFVEHEISSAHLYESFDHSLRLPKFVNLGAAAWGFGMVAGQSMVNDSLVWSFNYPCALACSEDKTIRDRGLRIAHSIVSTMQVMFSALTRFEDAVGFNRPQIATVDELHTSCGQRLLVTISPATCRWLSNKRTAENEPTLVQKAMLAAQTHMLGDASLQQTAYLIAKAPKALELRALDGCRLHTNGMSEDTSPSGAILVPEGLTSPFHQLILLAGLAALCQTVSADKPAWEIPTPPPAPTLPHEGWSRLSHPLKTD